VAIKGHSNLFVMPELASADGKKVMELLGTSSELSKLLKTSDTKASILIGSEINNPALSSLSIIVTHYTASAQCIGAMALIGPVRMNYPKVISTLEYVTGTVGTLLGDLLDSKEL
jgi:heat-inducible transcriptional repressor